MTGCKEPFLRAGRTTTGNCFCLARPIVQGTGLACKLELIIPSAGTLAKLHPCAAVTMSQLAGGIFPPQLSFEPVDSLSLFHAMHAVVSLPNDAEGTGVGDSRAAMLTKLLPLSPDKYFTPGKVWTCTFLCS